MQNKKRFAEIMSTLGIVFQREVDKALNRIYWECLKSFSDEEVEIATKKVLETLKFFPKPAEIIAIIRADKAMEGRISAYQAWGMVMSGLERGVCPKDQGIRETVRRIGGWDWLSGQSYDDLHWLEKRFIDHFKDLSDTQKYHQLKYNDANLLEEPKE